MARAIVTAKANLTRPQEWDSIRRGRVIQRDLALDLHRHAGVVIGYSCGIEEAKKFQAVLPNYRINIISADYFNAIIFSGDVEADHDIYLYHHSGHFDVITHMTAFLSKNYFCTTCKVGYDHAEKHRCTKKCHLCFVGDCHTKDVSWVFCQDCNRYFFNEECFQNHKREKGKSKVSQCMKYFKCLDCMRVINRSERAPADHKCGEIKCRNCGEYDSPDTHRCYMQPIKKEDQNSVPIIIDDDSNHHDEIYNSLFEFTADDNEQEEEEEKRHKYIFFDIETVRKIENPHLNKFLLEPNLIVAQMCCDDCKDDLDLDATSFCNNCGYKERVFGGESSLDDFCKFLFDESNCNSTVFAHNFRGFDGQFILKYCYRNALIPQLIFSGAKIMSIQLDSYDMKFLDSFNFIPMALSKIPAALGLGLVREIQKGHFPHFWNQSKTYPIGRI